MRVTVPNASEDFPNPRSNTVVFAGSIHEGWEVGDAAAPAFSVGMSNGIMRVDRSKVGQLTRCPSCDTPRVAAESGDYICCWCRDVKELAHG